MESSFSNFAFVETHCWSNRNAVGLLNVLRFASKYDLRAALQKCEVLLQASLPFHSRGSVFCYLETYQTIIYLLQALQFKPEKGTLNEMQDSNNTMLAFTNPLALSTTKRNQAAWTSPRRKTTTVCQQEVVPADSKNSAMAAAAATFVLKKSADAYVKGGRRPSAANASTALLQLEREQKRNKQLSDGAKLLGQWRLICTADPKARNPFMKAYYFPLRAQQTFLPAEDGTENEGIFDNGVFWFDGWANFRVRGPFRWIPKRNRMEFSVNTMAIKIGSWVWSMSGLDKEGDTLEGRTAKTLPFFTFFAIRDDIACARGRTGGLALYARVADDERL